MKPKYKMTIEENIFVAKRNIVDYIWKSANLEGLNVTYPETYAIYEKAIINGINIDTILTINNLKHGWKLIFQNLNNDLNLDLICKINFEIARGESLEWGVLRNGDVGIGGTDYKPLIPNKEDVENQLNDLLNISDPTERAIKTMFWGMKSQLFWDGNKRTSMMIANLIMIKNGCGIISVPQNHINNFNKYLNNYYSFNKLDEAVEFVYENCIDGIDFSSTKEQVLDNEDELEL